MSGKVGIKSEDSITTIKGLAKKRTDGVDAILHLTNDVSTVQLIFKKPNRTSQTVTAVTISAVAGTYKYVTVTTFFTANRGTWSIQAKYTLVGGAVLYSQIKKFDVGETLGA